MLERTRQLWAKQDQHMGDRHRLFAAVASAISAETVLYPGSYVDIAPSFVWPDVTYLDVDKRAKQFFDDGEGIDELLAEHHTPRTHTVRFVQADYTDDLDLSDDSFDLLISLYAGLISEHCTRHLRVGGHLLVNPSHGDVAMASLDSRLELRGVVASRAGAYRVQTGDLDDHLIPKRQLEITADLVRETGRGIAYTRSPFAYIFERAA